MGPTPVPLFLVGCGGTSAFPTALAGDGRSRLRVFDQSCSTFYGASFRSMTHVPKRSSLHASEPSRVGRCVGPLGSHLLAVDEFDFKPLYLRNDVLD
eukprot:scaffold234_cov353-Pavlova_lutheri.AAC.2